MDYECVLLSLSKGDELWSADVDLSCEANRAEPWFSGVQTDTRSPSAAEGSVCNKNNNTLRAPKQLTYSLEIPHKKLLS